MSGSGVDGQDGARRDASAPLGVVLGADSLLVQRSGVGRMTMEIARGLQRHPAVGAARMLVGGRMVPFDLDIAADAGALSRGGIIGIKRVLGSLPPLRYARSVVIRHRNREATRLLRSEVAGPVVYHEPNMITTPFEGTTVVTVNDLSWHHHPEMHPADRIAWIGRNIRRSFAQAARFVAISRFTADALSREFGIARDRVDVVPLAADAAFRPVGADEAAPVLAGHGLTDGAYVLSVSTVEPRKNFDRLLAAHQRLPAALRTRFPLVIVGGSGWGAALDNPVAERAQAEGALRLLGFVPDAHLVPLYARAAVFAYVSLYEGFGLPVLEAMATGVPVVASSTTAVGETAGPAALLVDPLDPDEIAAALRDVLTDRERAEALRSASLAHAARFTWNGTLDHLVATWRRATVASVRDTSRAGSVPPTADRS